MNSLSAKQMAEKLAELTYEQKQELLYGGLDEPYKFDFGENRYDAERGLQGLYTAIRLMPGLSDSVRYPNPGALLDIHKKNGNLIVGYIQDQVKRSIPESSAIRQDLLVIVGNDRAKIPQAEDTTPRVEAFMAYMDAMLAMENRQCAIVNTVFSLYKMQTEEENITDLFDWITVPMEFVERIHDLGHAINEENLRLSETDNALECQLMTSYIRNNEHSGVTDADIRGLLARLADNEFPYSEGVLAAAIEKRIPGITKDDVQTYIERCKSVKEYDMLRQVGVALINAMEVDWNGNCMVFGIDGLEEEDLRALLATCREQRDFETLGYLQIAAYRRHWSGINIQTIEDTISSCLNTAAGSLTNKDEWQEVLPEYAGAHKGYIKYSKAYALFVYAIENLQEMTFEEEQSILSHIPCTGIEVRVFGSYRHLAEIAFIKHHTAEIKGIPSYRSNIPAWVEGFKSIDCYAQAMYLAAAAVDADLADVGTCRQWLKIQAYPSERMWFVLACLRYPERTGMNIEEERLWMSKNLKPSARALLAVEAFNPDAPEPKGFGNKDIISWLSRCEDQNRIEDGLTILIAALNSGRVSFDKDLIIAWGNMAREQYPAKAVELGLSARAAGVPVAYSQVQEWASACFDGKTPEEITKNAISLIEMYQRGPVFRSDPDVTAETEKAFDIVMQQRETAGITDTLTMGEAVAKINNVLFGRRAASKRAGI